MRPGIGDGNLLVADDAEILVHVSALDLQQRRANTLKADRIEHKAPSIVDGEARL